MRRFDLNLAAQGDRLNCFLRVRVGNAQFKRQQRRRGKCDRLGAFNLEIQIRHEVLFEVTDRQVGMVSGRKLSFARPIAFLTRLERMATS